MYTCQAAASARQAITGLLCSACWASINSGYQGRLQPAQEWLLAIIRGDKGYRQPRGKGPVHHRCSDCIEHSTRHDVGIHPLKQDNDLRCACTYAGGPCYAGIHVPHIARRLQVVETYQVSGTGTQSLQSRSWLQTARQYSTGLAHACAARSCPLCIRRSSHSSPVC